MTGSAASASLSIAQPLSTAIPAARTTASPLRSLLMTLTSSVASAEAGGCVLSIELERLADDPARVGPRPRSELVQPRTVVARDVEVPLLVHRELVWPREPARKAAQRTAESTEAVLQHALRVVLEDAVLRRG